MVKMLQKVLVGSLLTLASCGNGFPWLTGGLIADSIIDGLRPQDEAEDGEDGLPGASCWDTNADFGCQPAEDIDGDGECTTLDCRGADSTVPGPAGQDGEDSTVPGPAGADSTVPGPAGPPGGVVIVLPPVVVPAPEDDPPHGNAYGHNNPPGNSHKPDKDDDKR